MPKPSNRDALIEGGLQTMLRKGYVGATVRDIAAAAGAPQGSFTGHFRSKEDFAGEVLDAYFEHVSSLMRRAEAAEPASGLRRLNHYLDLVTERLDADDFARGCLIGDFTVETPGHSGALRRQLLDIYRQWTGRLASWISDAQERGEIATTFSAQDLADFIVTGWEGAIARVKVEQSRAPLDRFRTIATATVLSNRTGEI